MKTIISIKNYTKTYDNGFTALKKVNLDIHEGEIFALLGPNGAGKTTLISSICGVSKIEEGFIFVEGSDAHIQGMKTRAIIGLVPQELTTNAFETVMDTTVFTQGLFGQKKDLAHVESVLKDLSLWEKRNNKIMMLSGGMKRRVMIAKALVHKPKILFLDEPSAGVDVELRKDMWKLVHRLKKSGVTIILTTHYIEEAEEMADRVGVINKGEIILVEKKEDLMKKLGTKELVLDLAKPLTEIPSALHEFKLNLSEEGQKLTFTYDTKVADNRISDLLEILQQSQIKYTDLNTKQSSLEQIFIKLVN